LPVPRDGYVNRVSARVVHAFWSPINRMPMSGRSRCAFWKGLAQHPLSDDDRTSTLRILSVSAETGSGRGILTQESFPIATLISTVLGIEDASVD
jgi:hypothetical protein